MVARGLKELNELIRENWIDVRRALKLGWEAIYINIKRRNCLHTILQVKSNPSIYIHPRVRSYHPTVQITPPTSNATDRRVNNLPIPSQPLKPHRTNLPMLSPLLRPPQMMPPHSAPPNRALPPQLIPWCRCPTAPRWSARAAIARLRRHRPPFVHQDGALSSAFSSSPTGLGSRMQSCQGRDLQIWPAPPPALLTTTERGAVGVTFYRVGEKRRGERSA